MLTADEAAGLTRLALAYCLGKGSISLYSRCYVLQIPHPKQHEDYAFYQWRRLQAFLPTIKPPRLQAVTNSSDDAGQWALRCGSRWFETAWRLLYGVHGRFEVNPEVLQLLGAEALGSLWADRGRVLMTRGANFCHGRLNLSRYSWESAALIHSWIQLLTGAAGKVHHSPRSVELPMLYYDSDNTERLVRSLSNTWMGGADCLQRKFRLPARRPRQQLELTEALEAQALMPVLPFTPPPVSRPLVRHRRRTVPEAPRPLDPPQIRPAETDRQSDPGTPGCPPSAVAA
jgi:hypothetical protein